ncbi:MAG: hypothetical protein H9777_06230 [Candidatus Phocaeicola faecigallinarum]|uniref:ATP-grasp domain-containing protein n=1 Tax=Candidatus Phocaeicola faecigallinarum TaxID=2838732 RepID=A0A948WWP4_9BACT|nr:hypothetical protein [Candidatus Phocaeicola faecigallinarum]
MILILSFYEYEQCTDPVIDWLLYYNVKFIKLTQQDLYDKTKIRFDIKNSRFIYDGIDLVKEVNCVYYRRFEDTMNLNLRKGYPLSQVSFELKYELNDLIKYIYYILKDKIWFPSPYKVGIDKLTALNIAESCGLKVPNTIVTNNKDDIIDWIKIHPSAIIKPIRFSGYYVDGEYTYNVYTNSISLDEVEQLDCQQFFPSLIQEKIKKDFEIRTFYLDGQIYASAIFTDDNEYDDIKRHFNSASIKWVPFKFPNSVEEKIRSFMEKISLNTGSIDMMKTVTGEFVFIEVNPVGQFIAPSNRCNYHIEQKIAKWLINHDKK